MLSGVEGPFVTASLSVVVMLFNVGVEVDWIRRRSREWNSEGVYIYMTRHGEELFSQLTQRPEHWDQHVKVLIEMKAHLSEVKFEPGQ